MRIRYLLGAAAIVFGLANHGTGSAAANTRHVAKRAPLGKAKPASAGQTTLANSTVRIGVDVAKGGAITFFGKASGGENLVNTHDLGRDIQASYYAGPTPYGTPLPPYQNMPWNPISAGDITGKPSRVVSYSNDGRTIYVKTVPKQWALSNTDCECAFEEWITLEGNSAWVRSRLTNNRADGTQYGALPQELPAIYTIAKLHRLVTYGGTSPYANDGVTTVPSLQDGFRFLATEHWAALVDDAGSGMGVFEPDVTEFYAKFFGTASTGTTSDFSSGYMAPTTNEILDHNVVYDYRYALVLGTASDVRAFATAHRSLAASPEFRFQGSRDHWTYVNATDSGWPVQASVKVDLSQNDPQLIGPQQLWPAGVSTVYIRAAYHGAASGNAQLFWHGAGQTFTADQSAEFPIVADGRFHTYAVRVPSAAAQRITQLRFDPSTGNQPGTSVELSYIAPQPIATLDAVG